MSETHFGIGVNLQPSRRCIESGDVGDVVVFTLTFFLLELERDTANGATLNTLHQMGGETEILLRRRFEGTTACKVRMLDPPYLIHAMTATHDFIDDSLVGVEIEGWARVAVRRRPA